MNWTRFALAVLASGIVASFTDWLFFGMLFHDKYLLYPEVWRKTAQGGTGSESKAIAINTAMGFVTAAAFLCVASRLPFAGVMPAMKLAAAIWFIGAMPVVICNDLFIK